MSLFLFLITQNSLYARPQVYLFLRVLSSVHFLTSSHLMALLGDQNNLSFSSQPLICMFIQVILEGCYFPRSTQHSE